MSALTVAKQSVIVLSLHIPLMIYATSRSNRAHTDTHLTLCSPADSNDAFDADLLEKVSMPLIFSQGQQLTIHTPPSLSPFTLCISVNIACA